MRFGISSSLLKNNSLTEFAELFRQMPQFGFSNLELVFHPSFDHAFLDRLQKLAQAHAIVLLSVHTPEKAWSLNLPADRKEATDLVKRSVEAAKFLGAKAIIVHANTCAAIADETEYRFSLAHSRDALRECAETALPYNILLAIENMPILHPPRCPSHRAEDLLYLLDGGPNNLRICYDTGHANINHHPVTHELKLLAPYLFSAHLHNNDGSFDHHCLPMDGNFDWPLFFQTLRNDQADPLGFFEISKGRPVQPVLKKLREFVRMAQVGNFDL